MNVGQWLVILINVRTDRDAGTTPVGVPLRLFSTMEVRGEQFVSIHPLLIVAGIAVTFTLWARLVRQDHRLVLIYVGALVSAFAGAKLFYSPPKDGCSRLRRTAG